MRHMNDALLHLTHPKSDFLGLDFLDCWENFSDDDDRFGFDGNEGAWGNGGPWGS